MLITTLLHTVYEKAQKKTKNAPVETSFAFKIDSILLAKKSILLKKNTRPCHIHVLLKFHLFCQLQEGPVKNSLVLMGQLLSGLFSDLSLNEAQSMVAILLTNR